MSKVDETHNPAWQSWVASANAPEADFPIQNLPFCVFSPSGGQARGGVGIGEYVLDLAALAASGLLTGAAAQAARAASGGRLNPLMALGHGPRQALRHALSGLLRQGASAQAQVQPMLYSLADVTLHLPGQIGGFTDFFASVFHATNAGRLFRPDAPLLPNYKYVPVGYCGRGSAVRVSGTDFHRPRGQIRPNPAEPPVYAPSRQLDFEAELGVWIGPETPPGPALPVKNMQDHVFGYSLLNDWSARDIQAWEYQPLGPFLGKTFATTLSPWIITPEALVPFRVPAFVRPEGDPAPLPHLYDEQDAQTGGLDIQVDVHLTSAAMRMRQLGKLHLCRAPVRSLYWTIAQLLTHHVSNGAGLMTGDLIGTGTLSGAERESWASLLELTSRGTKRLELPSGEQRGFLEDGDEISITAFCQGRSARRIGFGCCQAKLLPVL